MTTKNDRLEIRINSQLKEKFLLHAYNKGYTGSKLIEKLILEELNTERKNNES